MNTPLFSRRVALRLAALGAAPAVRLFGAPATPAPAGHVPERLILTWSGDPTTTQSTTWETAVDEPNRKLMAQVVNQTQCFQVIEVAPEKLSYAARSADGAIIDGFELRKSGTSSTYVNQAPAA
jgi:hypothetical protein